MERVGNSHGPAAGRGRGARVCSGSGLAGRAGDRGGFTIRGEVLPASRSGRAGTELGRGSGAAGPLLTCYLGRKAELLPGGLKPASPIGKKLKL